MNRKLLGPRLKVALHTHTTHSDGKFSPEEVVAAYAELQFDAVFITDHNKWNDHSLHSTPECLVLSANEPSLDEREHLLALGVHTSSPVDQGSRSASRTQEVLDWIHEHKGFSVVAHPSWTGMKVERLLELQRFNAIEIFNGSSLGYGCEYALTHWDELLRRGRKVWGVATDDSHNRWDRGLGWVEVFSDATEEGILNALHEGKFFASSGVHIHSLQFDGETLYCLTEPVIGIAALSERGPMKVVHGKEGTVTELEWKVPAGVGSYIRIECHRADGAKAWTQPIFLTKTSSDQ